MELNLQSFWSKVVYKQQTSHMTNSLSEVVECKLVTNIQDYNTNSKLKCQPIMLQNQVFYFGYEAAPQQRTFLKVFLFNNSIQEEREHAIQCLGLHFLMVF